MQVLVTAGTWGLSHGYSYELTNPIMLLLHFQIKIGLCLIMEYSRFLDSS